jgi:hypothetical protein
VDVPPPVRARGTHFQPAGPQQRPPFRDCASYPPETESRARRRGVRCSYDGRTRMDVKGRSSAPPIRQFLPVPHCAEVGLCSARCITWLSRWREASSSRTRINARRRFRHEPERKT